MRKWQKAAEEGLEALKDAKAFLQQAWEESPEDGTLLDLMDDCNPLVNSIEDYILDRVKKKTNK